MASSDPLPPDVVRLVGLTVVDPTLAHEVAARTSWIGDGWSAHDLLCEWRDELARFDAVAAVGWHADVPEVLTLIVNP